MLSRTIKRIAIVLALIAALTAISGFDAISGETLVDRFITKDALKDSFP